MVHSFHFLPTSLVFEILNPFSWIFDVISSDNSCLISTWRQDTRIFPPAESWLVNYNFPRASRMQGLTNTSALPPPSLSFICLFSITLKRDAYIH